MNHAGILRHESERPYNNRNYVLAHLDRQHFDALNPGNQVSALNGYCLDAIDEIPAGCMRQCARWPAQHYVTRGVSLAEQIEEDIAVRQLVAQLIAEEAAQK